MKRGISPLIAGVLLIGFTIVLAVLVITWVNGVFSNQIEDSDTNIVGQNICLNSLGDFSISFSWSPLLGYRAIINNGGSNSFDGVKFSWYDSSGAIGNSSYFNTPLGAYSSMIINSGIGLDYAKAKFIPLLNGGIECPGIEKNINFDKEDFNLILNPSFEVDTGVDFIKNFIHDDQISGNFIPDGWRPSNISANRMDLNSYDALYSLKLENLGGSTLYTGQEVPVEYMAQYQINGFLKVDSVCQGNSCDGSIGVHCLRANHSFIWGCPPGIDMNWNVTNDMNWVEIKYNTTITDPNVKYLVVLCYKTKIDAGAVFCDNFGMYKL